MEPFWPMGLGLKRGWTAIMDTCYAVDNLYNRTLELDAEEVVDNPELKGQDPDEYSWDMHWDNLKERCRENFESCNRVDVAHDIGKGEYAADSTVMLQWKRKYADLERPLFLVEIDPNTRYKKRNLALLSRLKRKMLDDKDWEHPVVARQKAILDYVEECKKNESSRGWNKLKSYGGKAIGAPAKGGYQFKAPAKKKAEAEKKALPAAEIAAVAQKKRSSLREKVAANAIEAKVNAASEAAKAQLEKKNAQKLAELQKSGATVGKVADLHDLAYKPPEGGGLADSQQGMHDRMQGIDKLSPEKKEQLNQTRMMLSKMNEKLAKYKEAEAQILLGKDVDMMKLMMM